MHIVLLLRAVKYYRVAQGRRVRSARPHCNALISKPQGVANHDEVVKLMVGG
jgi:hypothetical protein